MLFSGAWGKMIYEKPKEKILWHCPFNIVKPVGHRGIMY